MPLSISRRNTFKLFTALSATSVLAACGSNNVSQTGSAASSMASTSTTSTNDVGAHNASLFDGNSHEVKITVSDDDLATVLSAYQNNSEKEWVTANITIDGTEIENISLRLKGNSTLRGLSGQGGGPGGSDSDLNADDASTWPFLIAFDKNDSDDRTFQGYTRYSLRPGAPVLNEALALQMTAATNQPSQKFTYISYTLNDLPTTTRLMIVVPDEAYATALGDGILYKADADSSFSYQGDDESTYTDQFKQVNGDDDMQPVIKLLKWIDTASDEEFESNLSQYVDIDSFARYVATQNLIVNSDDMAGPGKNYYLWYDKTSGLFSVVSWDLNMAMTGDISAGPEDSASMGGGAPGGSGQAPAGGGAAPTGGTMPGAPSGMENGQDGGGQMSGNSLKTKFLAASSLTDTYHKAYWDLYDQIYANDQAKEALQKIVAAVPATDGLAQSDIDQASKTLSSWVDERKSALAALKN